MKKEFFTIGIDVGSTITKAVSIEDGKLARRVKVKASDPVAAATGAFGKIVLENKIPIENISEIKITGAGSAKIKTDIFGIPTVKIDEIKAIGMGGMFLSELSDIIIANVGTGTAIIQANDKEITHLGGSGVGGGTIIGLAKKMLLSSEFSHIIDLAKSGSRDKVDLLLEDITDGDISFLSKDVTVSNFGKMADTVVSGDIAFAIINMVYEVIGMVSVFAARSKNLNRVIVTGNGSSNELGQKTLSGISSLYGVTFIYPPYADYTTAAGAALSL
jgi:type II pantothenate kinase